MSIVLGGIAALLAFYLLAGFLAILDGYSDYTYINHAAYTVPNSHPRPPHYAAKLYARTTLALHKATDWFYEFGYYLAKHR